MNKNILAVIVTALLMAAPILTRAQQPDRMFPYPVVPDNKETLSERCNYLVYKFWEQCPIKQSFSSKARLNKAFGDWLDFMPYATIDTVNLSIDNYLAAVAKQAPDELVTVGHMAENYLYSDTAHFNGEEVYLRFVDAMLAGKKVPKAEKARYAAQKQIIESSAVGRQVPALPLTLPDGSTMTMADIDAPLTIVYFNDPDCIDCTLAKARLSADMYASALIDSDIVKVLCVYPGEPTDEWKAAAERYPEKWTVTCNPDIDMYFAYGELPSFYILDQQHRVQAKNLSIDNVLYYMMALCQQAAE